MEIKYLVVHCADTPNGKDFTAEDIHGWHKQRGWCGIGYHKVIRRDGTIENGRPEYWEGAHVKNHNHHSLGVCLVGKDRFTVEQLRTLKRLLNQWKIMYPEAEVLGHHNLFAGKTCPNFNVIEWYHGSKFQQSLKQKNLLNGTDC